MSISNLDSSGKVCPSVLDKWISFNGLGYTLGTDNSCLKLWKPFTDYTFNFDDPPPLFVKIKLSDTDSFSYTLCPIHDISHVSIKWDILTSRPQVKNLNKVFPYSSPSDKAHTVPDVASYISHITKSDHKRSVDNVLKFLPNILVLKVLIASVGVLSMDIMF